MPTRAPMHKPQGKDKAQRDHDRKAEYDRNRPSSGQRGYDSNWRKIRAVVLAEEPLCRACKAKGVITAANEVDHIIPHRGDREKFMDRGNLQSLCKPCHSRKSATQDSIFAPTYYG